MRNIMIAPLLFYAIALNLSISSCSVKVQENIDDGMEIDPEFSQIFFSVSKQKYLEFDNHFGRKKCIIIKDVDSTTYNPALGGIMRGKPFKIYTLKIQQVGTDTTRLERENEIFVNFDKTNSISSICIQLNNLYYFSDSLPPISNDTINIGNKMLSNYYLFGTSLKSNQPDDVVELYISIDKGIVAFKTLCGEFWVRDE